MYARKNIPPHVVKHRCRQSVSCLSTLCSVSTSMHLLVLSWSVAFADISAAHVIVSSSDLIELLVKCPSFCVVPDILGTLSNPHETPQDREKWTTFRACCLSV